MTDVYIGLMSGTSMDSIDAAMVDCSAQSCKLLATHSEPMPLMLKEQLITLSVQGRQQAYNLHALDRKIGKLFAQTVLNLWASGCDRQAVKAIGSHGQTIWHEPDAPMPYTLQIGDPAIIANCTGIPTVANFRQEDMAVGGQGAPITPAFHDRVLRHPTRDRVVVNIGGMANITVLVRNESKPVIGFDTGPGNVLLDGWIKQHVGKPFDQEGKWAAGGVVQPVLLDKMCDDPFFQRSGPKSTGREYFNLHWLAQHLAEFELAAQDVQATLTELTATTIANAIQLQVTEGAEILLCGGGSYNGYLRERIGKLLPGYQVTDMAVYGVPPDWLESMAFAWFAKQAIEQRSINLCSVTGAREPVIMGKITYPNAT